MKHLPSLLFHRSFSKVPFHVVEPHVRVKIICDILTQIRISICNRLVLVLHPLVHLIQFTNFPHGGCVKHTNFLTLQASNLLFVSIWMAYYSKCLLRAMMGTFVFVFLSNHVKTTKQNTIVEQWHFALKSCRTWDACGRRICLRSFPAMIYNWSTYTQDAKHNSLYPPTHPQTHRWPVHVYIHMHTFTSCHCSF